MARQGPCLQKDFQGREVRHLSFPAGECFDVRLPHEARTEQNRVP